MRTMLVSLVALLFFLNANAQSQKEKEQFMKEVFDDFKNNRLNAVTDRFIDSLFFEELITESIKRKEPVAVKYSIEEIRNQRKQALSRFEKSLEKAYRKFTVIHTEQKLVHTEANMNIYSEQEEPLIAFAMKYSFMIDSYDGSMSITRVVYDKKRKRLAIMADRVPSYFFDTNVVFDTDEVIEVVESEDIIIGDDVAIPEKKLVVPRKYMFLDQKEPVQDSKIIK